MLSSINVNAQELRGVVKDSITHKPLDYASVVVYGEQHRPITFQHTKPRRQILHHPARREKGYNPLTCIITPQARNTTKRYIPTS